MPVPSPTDLVDSHVNDEHSHEDNTVNDATHVDAKTFAQYMVEFRARKSAVTKAENELIAA